MSLVNTLAQNLRQKNERFDSNEFRITNAGLLNAFIKQTDSPTGWVDNALKETAMRSAGNTLQIPVIDTKDVTIRTTRPTTIAADENTSQLYSVTWTTCAAGFIMYDAQHYNNDVDMQLDFDKKMLAIIKKMTSHLEGLAYTAVNTDKTQVINEVTGGHTFASDVVSETGITTLDNSYIIYDLDPMLRSNDYEAFDMDVVGNQGFSAVLNRQEGYGGFNSENKTIQWNNKNFGFSNSITNALNKEATGFAIPEGTLGMLVRVEPDSVLRTELKSGHEWDTIIMPGLNIPVGVYTYEDAVDASSLGAHATHLTRTGAKYIDFAFDVAFITKYNSDRTTIPGPIIKFDIDTA